MTYVVKPLGKVTEMVQEMGLDVTYAFDDLVFVTHNPFLLRFADDARVEMHFNVDCPKPEADQLARKAIAAGLTRELNVVRGGRYELSQNEDQTISLAFSE